ncbi:hypothetical protein DY000_02003265 [Brassica cretica]|uniref:F-box domain-containing protein n=1 Tax=Brassica cretica TaxID=69181 RepID=A0ABQ7CBU2_BRACR|nr:hypothetical protein DY000_02003265 [Brassica cretica]
MSLSCCWNRSKQKSGENKTLSTFGLMDPPTSPAAQNPSSLHSDSIISSLLSFPASAPFSIACSFDRELEKALASASDDASVQDRLLNRTIQLASLLLDSTERCFRKRASAHNSVAWVLPPELTVKVFSKLDTKSLMQAAACCTMFNKCAMDRSSYAHIDLTTSDNEVVCTMIHRAGKELRSIKLGHVTRRYGPEPNPNLMWFNGPFLSSLSYNHGFLGSRLTSLRLYNVGPMHYNSLSSVLSVCSNLTDLRIVGSRGNIDASTASHLIELVTKSPNLTSLTLLCFQLTSETVRSLVQSCRKLKYLNLSRSPKIDGCFLRDLGNSCKESPLETLIMRNCVKLEEKEVLELCNSLLKGNFKFIRHIDVSSNNGLVSDDGRRSYKPKFPVEKLKEERPDVTLVADFPLERSSPSITILGFYSNLIRELKCRITSACYFQSCRKLKYLNLSRSPKIDGCFLRGGKSFELLHQVLLDRSLHSLTLMFQKEVLELCNSLLKGNFKFIRHIDVSSNNGLVSDDGRRSYKPKFPVEKLKEERPDVTLVADFPLERSSPSITILGFYSNLIRELKCRSGKLYHVGVEGDDEELREIEMMDAKNDEEENDDDDDDDDSFDDDDDDV